MSSGIVVTPEESHHNRIVTDFRRKFESPPRQLIDNHVTLRLFKHRLNEEITQHIFPEFKPIDVEFIGVHKAVTHASDGRKRYCMYLIPSHPSTHVLDAHGEVIDDVLSTGYVRSEGYHLTLMDTTDNMTDELFESLKLREVEFPFTMRFPTVKVLQPDPKHPYTISMWDMFYTILSKLMRTLHYYIQSLLLYIYYPMTSRA